jgi:hypothetical protein
MLLAALVAWLDCEQRNVIAFLCEENRVLKSQVGRRRLRLDYEQRRRLAVLGDRLGRTYPRQGRPGVQKAIRRLVVRMATDKRSGGTHASKVR